MRSVRASGGGMGAPFERASPFFVNMGLRENWERVRGEQARFLKQTCIVYCNFPCSGIISTVFT